MFFLVPPRWGHQMKNVNGERINCEKVGESLKAKGKRETQLSQGGSSFVEPTP